MKNEVNERVHRVVAAVFGVPVDSLSDASGPESIKKWDSLGHIQLIVALQSEFALSITPEQALEMTSVRAIESTLRARGISDV